MQNKMGTFCKIKDRLASTNEVQWSIDLSIQKKIKNLSVTLMKYKHVYFKMDDTTNLI